jgi:hypothetical protein
MARLGFLLISLLVLVLALACGGNDSDRATTVNQPTAEVSPTVSAKTSLTSAALDQALLKIEDMPTGWTVDTTTSSSNSASSGACGVRNALQRPERLTSADSQFTKGSLGPNLSETLTVYQAGTAKRVWDEVTAVLKTCTEYTSTNADGTTITFKLTPLSFPKLGDDTFALRLTADVALFGSASVDAIYVRYGDVFLTVVHLSIGLTSVDTTLTEQVVRKAEAKLRLALH